MNTQLEDRSFLERMTFRNWLALALAVAAIAFIFQNRDVVSIDLFFMRAVLPLWICLALVFVAGWLSGRYSRTRRSA
jgi:lipopolysaccharide assembly protein A